MLGVQMQGFELRDEDQMVVMSPFGTETLLVAHCFFKKMLVMAYNSVVKVPCYCSMVEGRVRRISL
jgi:hypothetical protein